MSQRKEMLMKNMEFVAYEGLNGKPGFQMTLHKSKEDRYYLYVACFRHNGFNIIDVTDPYHPTPSNGRRPLGQRRHQRWSKSTKDTIRGWLFNYSSWWNDGCFTWNS